MPPNGLAPPPPRGNPGSATAWNNKKGYLTNMSTGLPQELEIGRALSSQGKVKEFYPKFWKSMEKLLN